MAVRLLAIHIRGLPPVNYSTLRLVALNYLNIPSTGLQQILEILAEVEFVKFQTEGRSIKTVVPTVPHYETLYQTLGTFAVDSQFNAAEELSIALLCRLSKSPKKIRHPALEAGSGLETFQASLRAWKGGCLPASSPQPRTGHRPESYRLF